MFYDIYYYNSSLLQSVAVPSRRDLIQLGILSNNSFTVGSAIINLARTSFRMSQQNFQFGKTKSMESSTILQLLIVIILLSLGWNSLQFQYHLCYKLQLYGNFSTIGPKKNLNSLAQVDIFLKYYQLLLSFSYISCWTTAIFRHKPPWLFKTHVYLRDFTNKEGIECQFTTTVKLT